MTALVTCGQPDSALLRLAGGEPLGRAFDAVIGTVTNQVR